MKHNIVYHSKLFDVEKIHPTFRGKRVTFDRVRVQDCVVVIAFDEGKFVLERQYRPIVKEHLIEFPAGRIESGETPKQTALKELGEETGYTAKSIKPLFTVYSTPGLLTEKYHFFYAYNLKKGKPRMGHDESIRTMLVTPQRALEMVRKRQVKDLKTVLGIILFARDNA